MTLWSTRTQDTNREKNYVVIRHRLRDMNGMVHGAKFRGGYTVIDKNSKRYHELRKFPFLKNTAEFPITFLRQLKFVTRSMDVRIIWGQDAYYYYVKAITKLQAEEAEEKKAVEEIAHIEESPRCNFRLKNGNLCKHEAAPLSPSGFCMTHLLLDPELKELGLDIPGKLGRDEKKLYKDKVLKKLKSL